MPSLAAISYCGLRRIPSGEYVAHHAFGHAVDEHEGIYSLFLDGDAVNVAYIVSGKNLHVVRVIDAKLDIFPEIWQYTHYYKRLLYNAYSVNRHISSS